MSSFIISVVLFCLKQTSLQRIDIYKCTCTFRLLQ